MSDNALRRAGMAMLAIGLAVSLTACTPPNGAVGDTQSQDSAVAHVGPDRADTKVAFIGSACRNGLRVWYDNLFLI